MLLSKGGLSSPTGDYRKKITANRYSEQRFSKRLYGNKEWICLTMLCLNKFSEYEGT